MGFSVLATLILLYGCKRDASGTYLTSDPTAVVWLQLVRTPDDHLTGQVSLSKLNADGKVDFNSVPVTGAIGDGNVTLSGSQFFGLQSFTLSGRLDGNQLTLSGSGGPTPFVLQRAELPEYQSQLAKLNATSQSILAAKSAAERKEKSDETQKSFVARIDQLVGNMDRFDTEADLHLSRFPGVEKGYKAITAKINDDVEKERHLSGNPNASVARSQLSVAATQESLTTDQVHYQGQSLQSSIESNVKPMADEATNLDTECHESGNTPRTDLTPALLAAHIEACGHLANALPLFRQKYVAVTTGLAYLEQVYVQEKNAQQRLLETAQRLQ